MLCPTCKTSELEPVELEHGLIGAGCSKCKGSLLSLIQYRYWLDHHDDSDVVTTEDESVAEESKGAKLCPKCRMMMTKYRIGAETNNFLDLCSHCDEAWLDKGEWQLLKRLDLHDELPSLFTEAWQRNIRKQKERQSMEEHYTKIVGKEDFKRVAEFKAWLDSHSQSGQIKQYLNINFEI